MLIIKIFPFHSISKHYLSNTNCNQAKVWSLNYHNIRIKSFQEDTIKLLLNM
jgi:hypothetical protein